MASGLDLPEITSDNCLIAHWTAATVQVVSVGQRKWNGKVKAGGFVFEVRAVRWCTKEGRKGRQMESWY